ncbi:hypothetical protein P154DRAFT_607264 [Amniculicola lignicola CBS 123094]|uniref:Uncharacterized protein n=1 Tax=Amniculicola lignicola CBS 123094 TaxID=1392246 RepID=A0A6A5W863_9PLEO|nr:hypothetical protein P154DRAFT_607264 [Amniculicola lignicola CBS 123094]
MRYFDDDLGFPRIGGFNHRFTITLPSGQLYQGRIPLDLSSLTHLTIEELQCLYAEIDRRYWYCIWGMEALDAMHDIEDHVDRRGIHVMWLNHRSLSSGAVVRVGAQAPQIAMVPYGAPQPPPKKTLESQLKNKPAKTTKGIKNAIESKTIREKKDTTDEEDSDDTIGTDSDDGEDKKRKARAKAKEAYGRKIRERIARQEAEERSREKPKDPNSSRDRTTRSEYSRPVDYGSRPEPSRSKPSGRSISGTSYPSTRPDNGASKSSKRGTSTSSIAKGTTYKDKSCAPSTSSSALVLSQRTEQTPPTQVSGSERNSQPSTRGQSERPSITFLPANSTRTNNNSKSGASSSSKKYYSKGN